MENFLPWYILDKHMPNSQIKIRGNRILYVNSDVSHLRNKQLHLGLETTKRKLLY